MGVVFGFVFESDFAGKFGGKWGQKRSPKLKLCAPLGGLLGGAAENHSCKFLKRYHYTCVLSARKVMATRGPGLWANGRKIPEKVINKV